MVVSEVVTDSLSGSAFGEVAPVLTHVASLAAKKMNSAPPPAPVQQDQQMGSTMSAATFSTAQLPTIAGALDNMSLLLSGQQSLDNMSQLVLHAGSKAPASSMASLKYVVVILKNIYDIFKEFIVLVVLYTLFYTLYYRLLSDYYSCFSNSIGCCSRFFAFFPFSTLMRWILTKRKA